MIVGILLALFCGLANSGAAALEKREMITGAPGGKGVRILATLVRRPWWLFAMLLSALAWVSEALSLGLAPVPVVTTLRSAGRGGLVLAGHRWLGERFGPLELSGVVLLAVGGILTASSVIPTKAAAPPLSNMSEVVVAIACAAVAFALTRGRGGVMAGSAVGVLFVATGVFTKEIGDGFVRDGASSIIRLLETPGPWLMVALSVWALSLLQHAFAHANAATVSAAATTVSANGLILASVILYHNPLAKGLAVVILVAGIVFSALGAGALALRGLP